jgi:hypothetical protein
MSDHHPPGSMQPSNLRALFLERLHGEVVSCANRFIYLPSASRGHAVERALHLLFNALNGPAADATLAGNPQDAFADAQLSLDPLFEGGIDWPAEPLTLRHSALKASVHALPNHAALELKHGLACGCCGVEVPLVQEQVDIKRVQLGQEANQILQAAAKPID